MAQTVELSAIQSYADALGVIKGLQALISDRAPASAVQAVQIEAQRTSASLQAQILASLTELRGADASIGADYLAKMAALSGSRASRPGDMPTLFTSSRAGGDVGALPAWSGPVGSTTGGATALLYGAGIIVQRGFTAIENGRIYRPRTVYWRTSNTSDPSGDTIRSGVRWYDANKQPLVGANAYTSIKEARNVRSTHGEQRARAVIATSSGARVDFIAPPGAVYAKAFIETFGADGATAVAVVDLADITDATLLDAISADIAAQVAGLVSQNAGARLGVLESQAGNPNAMTFSTRGDAVNAIIPPTVSILTVLGDASPGDGGADTYRRALAGETVATGGVLGFVNVGGSAWLRTNRGPLDFVSPLSYPHKVVPAGSGYDWKQAIEAAAAFAVATGRPLLLDRSFPVSSVTFPRGLCGISAGGELRGIATTPTNAILDLPAGNVRFPGLSIWGNYNLNYARGVHLYGLQTQFTSLPRLFVGGVQLALTCGRRDMPYAILSETTFSEFSTYGCPGVAEVIGTETIVQFSNCQASADLFGAPASWSSLEVFGIKNIGAGVRYTGGELICTSLTYGTLVKIYPLDSTRPAVEGTRWGWVVLSGAVIETASALALINNPEYLTIASTAGQIGRFSVQDCNGFTSQDVTLIYSSPDFIGVIEIDSPDLNFPINAGTRAQPIVFCAGGGSATHVYLPRRGLGPGFQANIFGAVVGGIMHFDQQRICRALNLNQSIPQGGNGAILKFTSRDYAGAGARFSNFYDPSTGYFTVPPGGLLNVTIDVTFILKMTTTTGVIDIVDGNGNVMWPGPAIARGRGPLQAALGDLPAGTKFAIRAVLDVADSANDNLCQLCIAAAA